MKKFFQAGVFLIATFFAWSVMADEVSDLKDAIADLEERLNDIEDAAEEDSAAGWWTKTAVGGYGELHYNNNNGSGTIDFHRYVLFFSHRYNDSVVMNSEFELEHSIAGGGSAIKVLQNLGVKMESLKKIIESSIAENQESNINSEPESISFKKQAERILKIFDKADTGLVMVDGKLIEKPVLRQMQRTLDISKKLKT